MRATRRKGIAALAVLQLMVVSVALAQGTSVTDLFPARPAGMVTDVASLLDPASRDSLEDLLSRLRAATGAEVAVVTLPTIDDRDEAEVALAIGRAWGVGAKAEVGDPRHNAGLVLLLVPRQNHQQGSGHIRIEVGQGLEGIVTDALSGQIRREVMGPLLAQERYGEALTSGTRVLVSAIARGYGVTDSVLSSTPAAPSGGPNAQFVSLLPILIFILFLLLATRGGRRRRVYWGGPWIGGGWGGGGGFGGFGSGGGGFGGFGGGGGFSGGGSGGRF